MLNAPSRRQFLGGMCALALEAQQRTDPDVILYNANILTIDEARPRAQAVAIAGGRFLAVGSNDDVLHLSKRGTRELDTRRQTPPPALPSPPPPPSPSRPPTPP